MSSIDLTDILITNTATADGCISQFCNWLLDNPDRPLILLVTHDAVPNAQPHKLLVGLRIMENALKAYFLSGE